MKIMNGADTAPKAQRRLPRRMALCFLLLAGIISLGFTAGTMAYLSHKAPAKTNNFTVGNVTITIKENFQKPASMGVGTTTYRKEVTFKNEGRNHAYARVNFAFSNTDVANISQISHDGGNTWYSLADFRTHLPSGWAYQQSGALAGYYYYTQPLAPGASTNPLFTHVRTTFINKTADTNDTINKTPRNYDIYVYAEGLQQMKLNGSGKHTNYVNAWTEFLRLK